MRSGSTCHGAGRRMSRTGARRQISGAELRRQLEAEGIVVRCPSNRGLAEEAPFAYKDVERVVAVVERAGLADAWPSSCRSAWSRDDTNAAIWL